jgi:hypothetical protein
VQRDNEIAGVPATHCEREERQNSFDICEFAAVSDKLEQHPERQQRADAIANYLEYFERLEWGHHI